MNVPNILTSIRILVALIVPFFLIDESLWVRVAVGIICTLAVFTDWVDGWYARKYNLETKLGKILDPIADKVYVIVCFSVLSYLDVLSFWWIIPIILREVIITAYRFILLGKGIVVKAVLSGKWKTTMQMLTIGIAYLIFMANKHFPAYFYDFYWYVLYASLIITLYLTIRSGIIFFKNNWTFIKRIHNFS